MKTIKLKDLLLEARGDYDKTKKVLEQIWKQSAPKDLSDELIIGGIWSDTFRQIWAEQSSQMVRVTFKDGQMKIEGLYSSSSRASDGMTVFSKIFPVSGNDPSKILNNKKNVVKDAISAGILQRQKHISSFTSYLRSGGSPD